MSQSDFEKALAVVLRQLGAEAARGLFMWLTFRTADNIIAPAVARLISSLQQGRQPSPQEITQLQLLLSQLAQQQTAPHQQDINKIAQAVIEQLKQQGYLPQYHAPAPSQQQVPHYTPSPSPSAAPHDVELKKRYREEYEVLKRTLLELEAQYYRELDDEKRKKLLERINEVKIRLTELEMRILA